MNDVERRYEYWYEGHGIPWDYWLSEVEAAYQDLGIAG